MFSNSVKLSRAYPWVNLTSISSPKNHVLLFKFSNGNVTLECKDIDALCMSLATLFYELFPQEFRAHFDLPLHSKFVPPDVLPQMFVGLYISACHSLGHSLNDHFNKKLYKSLKDNPKLIDFTEFSPDKKMASALFLSLELTQNIKAIKVNESKHYQLFPSLIKLVKANQDLEEISFVNVDKVQGFKQFLEAVDGSSIISLNFQRFAFNDEMYGYLLYSNQAPIIQNLSFSECDIGENRLGLFMKVADRFPELTSLTIDHDMNTVTPSIISYDLKNFLVTTSLTTLNLRNVNMNLLDFFTAISGHETALQRLDLSLNIFTWKKDAQFELPETLEYLDLSQCTWDVDAILYMMSTIRFFRPTTLDLSSMTVVDNKYERLFNLLEASVPSTHPPTKIIWSSNKLDARFAMFLSRIHGLKSLNINAAKYEDDKMISILNSLVVLFQNTNITEFSLSGNKKRPNGPLICELLPVIQIRETLLSIDISSNTIGNQGVDVLARFIENSPQLQEVHFDGQQPTQVQPFLNVMKAIKKHPHLMKVAQPVTDMDALCNNFQQQKEVIRQSWNECVIHCQANREDYADSMESGLMSFVDMVQTQVDDKAMPQQPEEELQASWNVTLNLPVIVGDKEWDAMRKKYDIIAMTSIRAE